MDEDIVTRLRTRARIRREIPHRKSVQEGRPDRIADLLDEAANEIVRLRGGEGLEELLKAYDDELPTTHVHVEGEDDGY